MSVENNLKCKYYKAPEDGECYRPIHSEELAPCIGSCAVQDRIDSGKVATGTPSDFLNRSEIAVRTTSVASSSKEMPGLGNPDWKDR